MDLYFTKNTALRFRFPVTPRAVSLTAPGRGRTAALIDTTEISLPGGPGLREVSFEALLPNRRYPFAVYPDGVFRPAGYYLAMIEQLKAEREPFTVILGEKSMTVTLEGFTIAEDASFGGDVMISVRLRGTREAAVRILRPSGGVSPPPRPAPQTPPPRTYTVVRGDTLWAIARRFLGNGARWPEIHALNREAVPDPNLIRVGQVLRLP
jgi:nucleoid-associated protein YgaU